MDHFYATILMFGGNYAPADWAFCDGQSMPISQYQALYALIGTTYGGNGTTTFNLPDMRGRVPMHRGQGPGLSNHSLGEKGGAETVTPKAVSIYTGAASGSSPATPVGSNQPISIMQPYLCVNFIICLQGLFPSRP